MQPEPRGRHAPGLLVLHMSQLTSLHDAPSCKARLTENKAPLSQLKQQDARCKRCAPGVAAHAAQPVPAQPGSAAVVPRQLIAHSAAELWLETHLLLQTVQPGAAAQLQGLQPCRACLGMGDKLDQITNNSMWCWHASAFTASTPASSALVLY